MSPEELERMVHSVLRSLPDRKAPGTLEARILAEVERRAGIPWWHKAYSYWPLWARAAFLVGMGAVAGLFVWATAYLATDLDSAQVTAAFQPWIAFGTRAVAVVTWLGDFVSLLVKNIPSWWLYGFIAFFAGLYVMLFGLGAAAYRTLWANR